MKCYKDLGLQKLFSHYYEIFFLFFVFSRQFTVGHTAIAVGLSIIMKRALDLTKILISAVPIFPYLISLVSALDCH